MSSQKSSLVKALDHLERLAAFPDKLAISIALIAKETEPERKALANDGLGARVQAGYTGLETLLETSLVCIGVKITKGETSHKELLEAAEKHSLITKAEQVELTEIKGFQHIHRHVYDIIIQEDILKDRANTLIKLLPKILNRINSRIAQVQEQNEKLPGSGG